MSTPIQLLVKKHSGQPLNVEEMAILKAEQGKPGSELHEIVRKMDADNKVAIHEALKHRKINGS